MMINFKFYIPILACCLSASSFAYLQVDLDNKTKAPINLTYKIEHPKILNHGFNQSHSTAIKVSGTFRINVDTDSKKHIFSQNAKLNITLESLPSKVFTCELKLSLLDISPYYINISIFKDRIECGKTQYGVPKGKILQELKYPYKKFYPSDFN